MKKIITILIFAILIAAIAALFIPICFAAQIGSFQMSRFDFKKQYTDSVVLTISSENAAMEDLVIKYDYIVDNSMSETLKTTEIMSGENSFKWEHFFKFNSLYSKNPFNKHTIVYEKLSDYGITERPGKNLLLYDLAFKAQELGVNATNPLITEASDVDSSASFLDKLQLNYTLSADGDKSGQLFETFIGLYQGSSDYKGFFLLAELEENKLELSPESAKINQLLDDIFSNTKITSVNFDIKVTTEGCKTLICTFNGTYEYNGQTVPLCIKINEIVAYSDYKSVENLFPGLNRIDFESI